MYATNRLPQAAKTALIPGTLFSTNHSTNATEVAEMTGSGAD